MTTQPQSSGPGARDWPWTGSTASPQVRPSPPFTVPDNFDEQLTDAQIAPLGIPYGANPLARAHRAALFNL
jgi:hypothetical protein